MLRGLVPILWILATTLAGYGSDSDPGSAGSEAASPRTLHGDPPVLATPASLPFFYDLYTFRGSAGLTTVVAAVAVPVRRLRAERMDRRVRYRFDLRFVLADTARLSVFHTEDSVFVSMPRALARQHLLHTFVEVEAPPSTATVQRVVVTDAARPGVGQLYSTPFLIPDYSGTELMLSDIAFGLPDSKTGWTRRGATLALLPTSQFPESSFDVYYEIYNLPSGNRYETEFSFQPIDDSDGQDRAVRALFSGKSEAGEDGSVSELRRVASALPKGRYLFTVTVRDLVSGQVAANSRTVDVRGWRSGTTLVTAMPRGVGR
jgi:hypothetical protein